MRESIQLAQFALRTVLPPVLLPARTKVSKTLGHIKVKHYKL